jgi:hypothetical protein
VQCPTQMVPWMPRKSFSRKRPKECNVLLNVSLSIIFDFHDGIKLCIYHWELWMEDNRRPFKTQARGDLKYNIILHSIMLMTFLIESHYH